MSPTSAFLTSLSVVALVSSASAQNAPQLTARELFYSAAETGKPAPAKQEAVPKATPKKNLVAKKAPVTDSAPVVTAHKDTPPRPDAPSGMRTPDGSGVIQTAAVVSTSPRAAKPTNGTALGLRYTIQKRDGGRMVDVPTDTVFHSGDRIQFSVQTNLPGYLYIVSQGSSGTWKPMFPSPEIADGNNHVDGFHMYTMPPNTRIVFDEQKGTEKVFIVFSRAPEADLENIIYSLQGPKKNVSTPAEPANKPKQLLVASNTGIDDATIGRLRKTYTRDLIVEKVEPGSAGETKETAMYVVNPTGSSDSRVVADLSLVHQ
jgi:uncharacterized protein DUF4384